MPILHAIVLGIVQGLTEFLPISSSGHLLLVPWLFDWNDLTDPEIKKAFDVALHVGTLVAVAAYFRSDVVALVKGGLAAISRRPTTAEGRLAWLLVLSAVPAAFVGALFESVIDDHLGGPIVIAVSLAVFGLVLWWADRRAGARRSEDFGRRDALLIGAAQVLALNPGTSRSGITISAARLLGYERESATRLSFLMSLPVIAGAAVVKLGGLASDGVPDGLLVPMIVGTITAGVAGWFAVWGLLRIVRTRNLDGFVVYRFALAAVVLVVAAAR
ncbi:MAG: undecaprenyl-diphosphatase [Actinomycetota bacterium]|jgi:undecaprenyl-diphosphatase